MCLGLSHLTFNYWEHPLPSGSKATCRPRGPGTLPSSFFPGIRASTIRMVQRCGQAGEGIQLWDPISLPNSDIRCWEWATLPGSHCTVIIRGFVASQNLKVEVHKDSAGVHGQRAAVAQGCTPPQEDMGHYLACFNYEQRGALWLLPHKKERRNLVRKSKSEVGLKLSSLAMNTPPFFFSG